MKVVKGEKSKISFIKSQLQFPQSIYNFPKWDLVIELIKELDTSSPVLDIGFGYPFLEEFIGKDYKIYGIDTNLDSLSGLNTERYGYGNIEDSIPFRDKCFDGVIMLELIEHITNVKTAFSEIKRVLKPHGIIIITTPNYSFPFNLFWNIAEATYFRLFAKGYNHMEEHHINKYNHRRLVLELSMHFENVDITAFSFGLGLIAVCTEVKNEQ